MGKSDPQVTTIASATPSYPFLLLRLCLIRSRLEARVAVLLIRPRADDDERRLAVLLVAALIAVLMFLVCAVSGFSWTTCLVVPGVGFFAALGVGLVLLFGPDENECVTALDEVNDLLPAAKQAWQEQRAAARAARKRSWVARRQSWAMSWKARKQSWATTWKATKESWAARKQAKLRQKLAPVTAAILSREDSAEIVDLAFAAEKGSG
jgi:hypothetical protein